MWRRSTRSFSGLPFRETGGRGELDVGEDVVAQAAKMIHQADALIFTTGAGMGVASGHGTFR